MLRIESLVNYRLGRWEGPYEPYTSALEGGRQGTTYN